MMNSISRFIGCYGKAVLRTLVLLLPALAFWGEQKYPDWSGFSAEQTLKAPEPQPRWVAHLAKHPNFGRHDYWIWESAAAQGLDPDLWKAIVMVESSGDHLAQSWAGAIGLSQLMPNTAEGLGLKPHQLFEPEANLQAGAKYFSRLLSRFGGNVPWALAAYNAGPGAVYNHCGVPPFKETQKFIGSVMALHQWLKANPERWAMNVSIEAPAPSNFQPSRWMNLPITLAGLQET